MSQGSPLITTVIPTYRRPRLLRRAIYSVLNQTYPNLEVLVYDNASGDETADMCAEIAARDHRVKYLCHSQNIGVLNNFQAALQEVRTSFFSILSDDDVLLPEFYETALTAFDRHPDAIFVATRVVGMDSLGRAYPMAELTALPGYYSPPRGLQEMLLHGHPTWTGILFRQEVCNALGGLDLETGAASDIDFELRAAARFPFVTIDKVCAIFTSHDASLTTSARLINIWPCWLKMIKNLSNDCALLPRDRSLAQKILTARLKTRISAVAIRSILRDNYKDAFDAVEVLRSSFQVPLTARCLNIIVVIARRYPAIRYWMRSMNEIRRSYRRKNSGLPAGKVKEYSRHLQMWE